MIFLSFSTFVKKFYYLAELKDIPSVSNYEWYRFWRADTVWLGKTWGLMLFTNQETFFTFAIKFTHKTQWTVIADTFCERYFELFNVRYYQNKDVLAEKVIYLKGSNRNLIGIMNNFRMMVSCYKDKNELKIENLLNAVPITSKGGSSPGEMLMQRFLS